MMAHEHGSAKAPADPRRILVAEDNPMNRKLILRQLALLGFDAEVAGDGCEALACWERGGHALLLCDVYMPRMDGFALARAIRTAEQSVSRSGLPRIPIIALTASALGGEAERCRDAGMDGHLGKPLQLADLKALLQAWVPDGDGSVPTPGVGAWPASADVPVDVRVLEALIGPDPAINRKLQRQFQRSALEISAKLGHHCLERQPLLASEQAHTLCSAARAVGALALCTLCMKIEMAGKAGDADALAELWGLFERELAAVNRFLDGLESPQADRGGDGGRVADSPGLTP